jgi:large conductance mechanosensitive channel
VSIAKEFKDFLREFKVIGLTIAFIFGLTTTKLVQSLVDDVLLPIIEPFTFEGSWQLSVLRFGPVEIGWGQFLSALLNFLLIALIIFVVVKKVLRWKPAK